MPDASRSLTYNINVKADTSQAQSSLQSIVSGFGNVSNQADSTGSAFRKSFLAGIDSGNSFSSSLRQGIGGALEHTKDQAESFRDSFVGGAQKIGNALTHPIETIKGGLGNAVKSAEDKFTDMARSAENAADGTEDLGQAADKADDDIKSAGEAADSSSHKFENLGKVAKIAGVAIVAAIGAVGAFAASSVNVGMEFDSSMSQVAATMGKTTDEIGDLRDFALEMGSTTAFSASQAADALNYMALAGYDSEQSMQALPNVLNLAAAGGIDLARASDMVTDAQSALGLSMDESAELVDKMAMASSRSNTSVEQLGDAILAIGGTAKNLAGGTTELSTALGILADNGIKGAEGGTHLRNIIMSLGSPSDQAAAALKNLGVEVFDADGNMRPLEETFGDLNAALSDMSQGDRLAAIGDIFNTTDIASVNALLATDAERWQELGSAIDGAWVNMDALSGSLSNVGLDLTDMQGKLGKLGVSGDAFSKILNSSGGNAEDFATALLEASAAGTTYEDIVGALGGDLGNLQTAFDETTGAAQAMADTQLDNLAGDITLFKSALEGAQIVVSDQLTPYLREFVQLGSDGLSKITAAFQEGGLSGAMGAFGEVLSDAVGMIVEMLPEVMDAGMQLLEALGQGLIDNLPVILDAAIEIVMMLADGILRALPELLKAGIEVIATLANGIGEALPELIPTIVDTVITMVDTLIENLPLVIDAGMNLIGGLIEGIVNAIPMLVERLPELLMSFIGYLTENGPMILEQGMNMILNLGMGIINAIPQLVAQLPAIITGFVDFITTNLPAIVETGINLIVQLAVGLVQAIPQLVASLPQIITAIVQGFAQVPGMMIEIGGNIVKGVWEGITALGSWIKDKVTGFFGGIVDGVKGLLGIHSPSTVFAGIGDNMAQGLGNGFEDTMGKVTKDIEDSIPTDIGVDPIEVPDPIVGDFTPPDLSGATADGGVYNINPVVGDVTLPQMQDGTYNVNPIVGDFTPPDLSGASVTGDRTSVVTTMEAASANTESSSGGNSEQSVFAPNIQITVNGNPDETTTDNLRESIYNTVKELFDEFREEEREQQSLKNAYAF